MNTDYLSGMVKLIRYVLLSTFIIEGIGAIFDGEGKGHAVVVPRLLEPLLEDVVRVLGKRREVTEESEPHVLLSKERQFLDERRCKEVHLKFLKTML